MFLLQAIFMIPTKPPPSFKEADKWSKEFNDFVSRCLVKNPEERATATQLLQASSDQHQISPDDISTL